jgi:hypothetical protein
MNDQNSSAEKSISPEEPEPTTPPDQESGLTQAQQAALEDFEKEMTDSVIPEIVRVVEERRVLATLSRQWPLKIGAG